ncbi:type II secretion system protein N [Variovorax paradoxus]|uniref:Type II secretion system protein N n=1 Tax=Variovorax paradoxus (strain EPS) TaxID=595537 RepID=E6UWS8_VARPE|nr:type II secretion system protein N [Variovorax paradoxus]ADU35375.1 putative general secretory pathway N transmembrane protein [Variovorax paradoxus EPS]
MVTRPPLSALSEPKPRRGWRWALLGILIGALLAVVLFAPARWLASALSNWTQGRLLLVNPRGTVWNGAAAVVFASGTGSAQAVSLPGLLHWRLRPSFSGVFASLDLPCCAPRPLELKASPRGNGVLLDWQDGRSRWPATMLTGLGAPWNTLKLDGALDLSTKAFSLQWDGPVLRIAGQATLDATDVSSSLSTLKPMGSYRLSLEGGNSPTLLLSTREGSLQLNGSGSWNGTAFRFNGEASAAAGREDALSNLLNIIGRRDNARSIITLG